MNILEKKKLGYILTPKEKRSLKFIKTKTLLEKEYKKKLSNIQIRYLEKGIRKLGYWDIETKDFNPYQGCIYCFVFYIRDVLTNKITKREYHVTKKDVRSAYHEVEPTSNFDVILLQKLSNCMEECDQIIGHFSTKFDMNYFRSRCILTGQENLIPDYQNLTHGDTWRMMKTSLKAPRNTLNNFALQTSGKSDKTFVDLKWWNIIPLYNHPKWDEAAKYILDHCRKDVKMTYVGHKKVEKFNSISGVLV